MSVGAQAGEVKQHMPASITAPKAEQVLSHYADLAHAMYQDALLTAEGLQGAVKQLVAQPTQGNLIAARSAWKLARVPYQQTEAYRFGNAIVDAWEGKVNAWPLDEGLIDYVANSYGDESDENPQYTANLIANPKLMVNGQVVDATNITKKLLAETLHEMEGVEANVATGYHAIEFLLWGQDLNGTAAGAGNRPATDFDTNNCTGGNCDRRGAYLKVATELLIDDLAWMTEQWTDKGQARQVLLKGDHKEGIVTILTGMGSLSYGELAGERMKLGVMLHDPEEEHDCFSDNTHYSHYYDALGIRNVYTGSYRRIDGSLLKGPSLSQLVAAKDVGVDLMLRTKLNITLEKMQVLTDSAQIHGEAYDQLLDAGNTQGNKKIMDAVHALVAQTKSIEKAVTALGVNGVAIEGSDSLDAPHKVQ
ncbi:imelysin family protein [Magnetococcus sp. PR-3]|uniref:imelysin family protein n=1 Tax=Magnetococcus sp. PR-3 TaxID=3120355 RepID=UPI003FA5880A